LYFVSIETFDRHNPRATFIGTFDTHINGFESPTEPGGAPVAQYSEKETFDFRQIIFTAYVFVVLILKKTKKDNHEKSSDRNEFHGHAVRWHHVHGFSDFRMAAHTSDDRLL